MITSMTGFSSLTSDRDDVIVTVTIKSVNHRYLDIQVRAPIAVNDIEYDIRELVQSVASRGRVEVAITMQLKEEAETSVEINESLILALSKAAKQVQSRKLVTAGLSVGDLFRFPKVVTVREQPVDEVKWRLVCDEVKAVVQKSLTQWSDMRRREGKILERDLNERVTVLSKLIEKIVDEATVGEAACRDRLVARLEELSSHVDFDDSAAAHEVVRWAARSDIHEEITRLRGHLEHMGELAAQSDSCGRKLDFLVQEMNREVNTIGSKAEGRGITELVVGAKSEIEKLREQIQNVE